MLHAACAWTHEPVAPPGGSPLCPDCHTCPDSSPSNAGTPKGKRGLLASCKPELRSVPRSSSARKEFNSTGPPGVWRTAWNIPLAQWLSRQSDRQADSWLQLLKVSYVGERKLRTPAAHRIPFQIWVSSDVSESDDGGSQITSNRQIRRRALTLHVKELCSVCQEEEASDDTGTGKYAIALGALAFT